MIETTLHDQVTELRLANPPANAMSLPFIQALNAAICQVPKQGGAAIVLTTNGNIFSAGLDVPSLLPLGREGIVTLWRDLFTLMRNMIASPVPIVGALSGHSPAGGCVLAICCDHRIMATESRFRIGLNEVAVGLPMPDMIYQVLSYLVGRNQAARMCSTGELMDSEKALRIGLVDQLVPAEQVREAALDYAQELTRLPPVAMQTTRNQTRAELLSMAREPDEKTLQSVVDSWFTEEAQQTLGSLVARLKK